MIVAALVGALLATAPPPARVQVQASEFEYVLSRRRVKTGRVILELVNFGEDPHDLALRRIAKTARTFRTPEVLPEGEARLSMRLVPGRYQLWCTIADHRALGMRGFLTVTRR